MPATVMERVPLPRLGVYSAGSAAALAAAVYHAAAATSAAGWRARHNATPTTGQPRAPAAADLSAVGTRDLSDHIVDIAAYMMQEPLCMWAVMNMAYCCVAVVGGAVRRAAFGPLRVAEAQRLKDRFWNYVFYKFIFVFGVVNVQYMDEVVAWCAWFTGVGFLHLLAHLCNDRFDYISSSTREGIDGGGGGGGGAGSARRVVALSWGVSACGAALLPLAAKVALPHAPDTFAFMAAECVLVVCSALHVCARAVLARRAADPAGPLAYYTHLVFDSMSLCVEACHVGHMVVVSRAVVSLPALVLVLQLRHLLHQLHRRLRRHRLYTALAHHMTTNYPMASAEEVAKHCDKCAICWEPMREARKLPCHHLFHNSCLWQWVQQDASCPTCRRALSTPRPAASPAALPPPPDPTNHLFRFDGSGFPAAGERGGGPAVGAGAEGWWWARWAGAALALLLALVLVRSVAPPPPDTPAPPTPTQGSRYVSWLPSFSVEVSRGGAGGGGGGGGAETAARMAAQVQALFPQYSRAALLADLAVTHSADRTVDNILEGRLRPPSPPPTPPPAPPAPPARDPPVFEPLPVVAPEVEERWREPPAAMSAAGPREFSSEARARETMLAARKRVLVDAARRRYLQRLARARPRDPDPAPPPPS